MNIKNEIIQKRITQEKIRASERDHLKAFNDITCDGLEGTIDLKRTGKNKNKVTLAAVKLQHQSNKKGEVYFSNEKVSCLASRNVWLSNTSREIVKGRVILISFTLKQEKSSRDLLNSE